VVEYVFRMTLFTTFEALVSRAPAAIFHHEAAGQQATEEAAPAI
jgi:hypothetical protein